MRSSLDGMTKVCMHASCQEDCIQESCRKSPEIRQFDAGCTVFSHAASRLHQMAAQGGRADRPLMADGGWLELELELGTGV